MALNNWKKLENEAGYPCYLDETTSKQQYDHPQFQKIMESLAEYDGIKYSTYKIAFKIFALQTQLDVPPLRISAGVFARHQLSLSESSLSLDPTELEAVLADIYFAAEKEGIFNGDVDLTVDLLINLLLNVYDSERKEPVRVLSAKTLLIILSKESAADKWSALANCCADHNGCVSPRRLAALMSNVIALPEYLGVPCDQIQNDIDSCFDKSAGMLGVPAAACAAWGAAQSAAARWLGVLQRVLASRNCADITAACSYCLHPLIQVLKFKCSKCNEVYFCEKCYLYEKDLSTVNGHKKSHLVHEIVDGELKPSECLSFIRGIKRFFFCTRTKKKKVSKKTTKKTTEKMDISVKKWRDVRPAMVTSTVGKASGNAASNPTSMLQDIITQLEVQNKALEDLSSQLQSVKKEAVDDELKIKVEAHWHQISMQINRLKILKENLSSSPQNQTSENQKSDKIDRPQAFDLFSPIPVLEDKQSKVTETMKNQPRVLSMDSGNFSVVSKQTDSQNLMTMSGDALRPVVVHATSDSISTVSMNDITNWYNETGSATLDKPEMKLDTNRSITATERKYAADIRSVETSNDKMKELNADLDTVLDRLQQILSNNFAMDDSCFDNTQLRETANEMEGLLGTLIRGVEQRATLNATNKGLV
ncbi:dystrotelin [Amyelois transitella]|uniref:dystrotelin n=1 Tax=Amyelois transitella TaxID=680683 RepID=UPI00067A8FCE|nr:dystrotelin [Amyelois transitella]